MAAHSSPLTNMKSFGGARKTVAMVETKASPSTQEETEASDAAT